MAFPSEGALLGMVGEGAPLVISFYNGNSPDIKID